jgi:HEAT repeat protein
VRKKAAHALGELRLPEAVEKLRQAYSNAGDAQKVALGAALFRLGDKDVRASLLRATEEPSTRLEAALALAEGKDAAGKAVLADVLATSTPERASWWRAARGLVKLDDAATREALQGELAHPEAKRRVEAADILAQARDAKARDQLARMAADPDFSRRGESALALARLEDARALEWVAEGLASTDSLERRLALAICGALSAGATAHGAQIAALTMDPDFRVRLTAEAVLLGMAGTGGTK